MPASVGAAPFTSRMLKKFTKRITFTGAAGLGAVGSVAIGTIKGSVCLQHGAILCTTDLVSSGGTIELGVTGNTAAIVAQTTASALDAGEFWQDASPEAGVSPGIANVNLAAAAIGGTIALILTVGSAIVSAGVIDVTFYYLPLSSDGLIY